MRVWKKVFTIRLLKALFNAASTSITSSYITPFALKLGATNAQIGMLSSLQNLASTIAQLPGASLTEKLTRKSIWVYSTFISRILWIPVILIPFLSLENPILLLFIFLFLVSFFTALRNPAWSSLIGDLVPDSIRGRYFGKRNMFTGIAGLGATLAAGYLLNLYGFPIIFIAALVIGLLSIIFFIKIREPNFKTVYHYKHTLSFNPRDFIVALGVNRNFVLFTIFMTSMNFAVNIAAPFFTVYMLKDMGIGYLWFAVLISFEALVTIAVQPYGGRLNDRYGKRKIMFIAGTMICFVPFIWLFVSSPWHILFANFFSGFAWAGFDLSAFNFLLVVTPSAKRPNYVANHTFFRGLATVAGALLGGFLAESLNNSSLLWLYGLQIIFLISFILRIVSLAFLTKITKVSVRESDIVPVRYVFWRAVAVEPARGMSHAIDYTFRYPYSLEKLRKKFDQKMRAVQYKVRGISQS